MKRLLTSSMAALFCLIVTAESAQAQNPRWNRGPTATVSGGNIVISGKATGLGNVPSVDFLVTGSILLSSRCYTRRGNTPQAANKQESHDVNAGGSFPVSNGQTTVSISEPLPSSTLDCPGGQRVVVESCTYDLQIDAAGFPSLSREFSGSCG